MKRWVRRCLLAAFAWGALPALASASPQVMVSADLDGNGLDDVAVDFGSTYGIWIWQNNAAWVLLHALSPHSMAAGDLDANGQDDLILDFGPGYGIWIWQNNAAWVQRHGLSSKTMVTGDLDGSGRDDVIIDFGLGYGIWIWQDNTTWLQRHGLSPKTMVTGDLDGTWRDELIVDFGPGYGIWVWQNNTAWVQRHSLSADSFVVGDFDANGLHDLAVDFGTSYGIWVWQNDAAWVPRHSVSPDSMVAGDIDGGGRDDLIIDFGPAYGIWVWQNNASWVPLHGTSPQTMATGDLDGDGRADVLVDFGPAFGLWTVHNTSWVLLNGASPSHIDVEVRSSTPARSNGRYPTGSMVRIDATVANEAWIAEARIRITSATYDSGLQDMSFGSLFYLWDTASLLPNVTYTVTVVFRDIYGGTFSDSSLRITLVPAFPAMNRIVSEVDASFDAVGLPTRFMRSYLLDSTFNGPMGYGWTHTYRMRLVTYPGFRKLPNGALTPVAPTVQVFNADGTGSYFRPNGDGTYQSAKGDFRRLTRLPNGVHELRSKSGLRHYFSGNGKLFLIVDPSGNLVRLRYDGTDRLTGIEDPSGRLTSILYDGNNRIQRVTDPAGRFATYAYDAAGNLVSVVDNAGGVTTYQYDAQHNLTSATDALGRRVFFTTDSEDRLLSVSGEGGANEIRFGYGTPSPTAMSIVDALGSTTVMAFNTQGLVTSAVDPAGNSSQFTYDSELNLLSVTNSLGRRSTFTYDTQGNLLSTTDPSGGVLSLAYDLTWNRVSRLTDERGNSTTFTYDTAGRLTATTYPDGTHETYQYSPSGNMTARADRKGQTISYAYDLDGRLTRKSFPDGTSDVFTYDLAGHLTSATDENGAITFTYDSAGHLTRVLYPGGEAVSYAYDLAGNRSQLVYPDGRTLDYAYDNVNRLNRISQSSATVVQYAYDAMSRIVRRDLANGTFTTYAYDASSQLLDLVNRQSTGSILSRFAYTYDALGNRLSMTTLEGTTQYAYDLIGQLTGVQYPNASTTTYDLDPAGNRASVLVNGAPTNYVTNSLNQYTSVGGDSYTYDLNGNTTSKTTAAGTTTYTYDFENRLTRVVTPTQTVTYSYDPFGRRVSKTTAAGTTRYIHDGWRVIMEKNGAGAVQASYLHGQRIDEIVIMNRGGANYYYSQDGLLSPTNLTDPAENIVESYSYDAFGLPTSISSVGNPHLFTGREFETEIGLYYSRARYYDARTGKFIVTDPLGLSTGPNLYTYVSNNPVNFVDPSGQLLAAVVAIGARVGAFCLQNPAFCYRLAVAIAIPIIEQVTDSQLPPGFVRFPSPTMHPRLPGRMLAFGGLDPTGEELFDALPAYLINPPPLSSGPDERSQDGVSGRNLPSGEPGPEAELDCVPLARCTCQEQKPQMCMADPTFIQVPQSHLASISALPLLNTNAATFAASRLVAKVEIPYKSALVRADVPIFGVAHGADFKEYRVEFGKGADPKEWVKVASSTRPQETGAKPGDLDDSLNTSIRGNLATWDTGLKNYVYLPSHPADHPIDLKGTYTVRLVVTGRDGTEVEDRVTVTVADVIPNAWGGVAKSPDGRVRLTVPEQAIRDVFRLVSFEAVEEKSAAPPPGARIVSSIYQAREAGESFTTPATLEMTVQTAAAKGVTFDRLGLYGFDERMNRWEHLTSTRSEGADVTLRARVRTLHAFYAVMAGNSPKEGSTLDRPERRHATVTAAASAAGHYLVRDTFEETAGAWSNRNGDAGASVALDRRATFDGSGALKITNTNRGGTFAVNVLDAPFDARAYPLVRFDYRIGPGVKTDFLVKVSGRWYDIGFTDDQNELAYKRVNIAPIGRIDGIVADDTWRTARFNLYDMLRTRTGSFLVEEMILADWDVPGFMKLAFGANQKGATYYIDNFSIERDVRSGVRVDDETLRVDDFNQKKSANLLGGTVDAFTDGDSRTVRIDFAQGIAGDAGHSLRLAADFEHRGSYAGYTTALENLDLRDFRTLTFRLRTSNAEAALWSGLKDRDGHESRLDPRRYATPPDADGWRTVEIPLAAFGTSLHLSAMDNLSLAFTKETGGPSSTAWVDDLAFQRLLRSVAVDDFDSDLNFLGLRGDTRREGPATIDAEYVGSESGRALRVSFGGSIGDALDGAPGLGYALWYTALGGIDCSACGVLSFRIRGEAGGEKPNIYLDDGNHRWGVDIEKYAPVTTTWQTVTIPLADLAEYGVDLTHLEQIQFAFEWEQMSGAIELEDIRLGAAEDGSPSVGGAVVRRSKDGGPSNVLLLERGQQERRNQ